MSEFRDQAGQAWNLEFSFSTLKRVKKMVGVDLLEPTALQTIGSDICKFVDTLYAVCEPQAEERGLTDVMFADQLVPCFNDAVEAFFLELEVFFRRLGRTALATLIQQILMTTKSQEQDRVEMIESPEMKSKMQEASQAETEKIKRTMLEELDRVIAGETATDSPASSASTSTSSTD